MLARRFLLGYAGGVPGGFSRLPRSTEGSDNCDNCVAIQDFELCHSTSIPREATLGVLGYSQAGGYEGGYMRRFRMQKLVRLIPAFTSL